jgi:hypothetical protein
MHGTVPERGAGTKFVPQDSGSNRSLYIMRSFMICTLHQLGTSLCGSEIEDEMMRTCSMQYKCVQGFRRHTLKEETVTDGGLLLSKKQLNSAAWVRECTVPKERQPRSYCQLFADKGCRVVSATDSYGHILGLLDRSLYFSFKVSSHLYWRGWVNPIPDPLLVRKSDSTGNRTQTYGSVAGSSDHYTQRRSVYYKVSWINKLSPR